jgi:uncharacterized membrane protein YadS
MNTMIKSALLLLIVMALTGLGLMVELRRVRRSNVYD